MHALPSSSSGDKPEKHALTITAPADGALTIQQVLGQVSLIQQIMGAAMKDGEHFGKIPGCGDKPTLLKPGAEKLCLTFRLAPTYEVREERYDEGHREFRVQCSLTSIVSQSFIGQGVGSCSTLEAKYRYRGKADRVCPNCGVQAIIKGRAEYGGGWVCFNRKGGCGAKFRDGDKSIEDQSEERQENPDLADQYNTVLKMAKKRALVDAVLTATAASDIFTQDLEDITANLAAAGAVEVVPNDTGKTTAAPAAQNGARSKPVPAVEEAQVVEETARNGTVPGLIAMSEETAWNTEVHFGTNSGKRLKDLAEKSREYYFDKWMSEKEKDSSSLKGKDIYLYSALHRLAHGEPERPQDWLRLEGCINKIQDAEGKLAGKPVTFSTLEFALPESKSFSVYTTDEKFARLAYEARDDGTPMVAFYKPGKRAGSFEVMNLVTLESDQAFEAGMDAAARIVPN